MVPGNPSISIQWVADLIVLDHPPSPFWELDASVAAEVRWIMSDVINPKRNAAK